MPIELFDWPEARTRARAGARVRRADWETQWLRRGLALWWIDEDLAASRVVQTADFAKADRFARDWTADPWEEPDPCERPAPATPPFVPPALSMVATLGGPPVFRLRLNNVSINYSGPNPGSASADGTLELAGSYGQDIWEFSGTLGDFLVAAIYNAALDRITYLSIEKSGEFGVSSDAGEFVYAKAGSDIDVPQFEGTLYFDEIGDYDLASGVPGDQGVNTARTDGGTVTVERVGSTGVLLIAATLGSGDYPGYGLTFLVNGQPLAVDALSAPGSVAKQIPINPSWLEGDIVVELWVDSALPLPAWRGTAQQVIELCEISETFRTLGQFVTALDFPASDSGTLPRTVSGASLAGLDVVNGADYPLQSDGSQIFCDFPAYTGPGAPYGYDGTCFFISGVVRRNFDFSYEYKYEAVSGVFTGAKNLVCLGSDPTLWDHAGLHIGTWADAGGFPSNPLRISIDESWVSHVIEQIEPAEADGLNMPSALDTWHTRRLVKRGDAIYFTDGAVGPLKIRRCWLDLRGHVGLIISGGVRVRNLKLREV